MRNLFVALAVTGALASPAHAAIITSALDPLLTGATLITFTGLSDGTTDPTVQGVSFMGEQTPVQVLSNTCTPDCGPVQHTTLINRSSLNSTEGTPYVISFFERNLCLRSELQLTQRPGPGAYDSANNLLGRPRSGQIVAPVSSEA